jgi:hypothetical protein
MRLINWRSTLAIWLSSLSVISVALSLARNDQLPLDPFAPYRHFLPGQSAAQVSDVACDQDVASNQDSSSVWFYCFVAPQAGPFSQIGVVINDHEIRQTRFITRGNLTIGDLARLWGNPVVARSSYREWITLYWPANRISARVQSASGRFSYFLPVAHVVFSETHSLR